MSKNTNRTQRKYLRPLLIGLSIAAVTAAVVLLTYQIVKIWWIALVTGGVVLLGVAVIFLVRLVQDRRKPPLPVITLDHFREAMTPVFAPGIRLISRNTSSQIDVLVDAPAFTIGRSEDCQYRIDDDAVSRRHCTILCDIKDGHYEIRDEGSANGTGVNGETVRGGQARPIAIDDVITIEKYQFTVRSAYV